MSGNDRNQRNRENINEKKPLNNGFFSRNMFLKLINFPR